MKAPTLNVSTHGPSPEIVACDRDVVADLCIVEESRSNELIPEQGRLILGG